MSSIKDKNVHLYMKNGGLSYELSKDCLAKMVYGYQIGFKNSMEMDLSRISNEDFCEIFLKVMIFGGLLDFHGFLRVSVIFLNFLRFVGDFNF